MGQTEDEVTKLANTRVKYGHDLIDMLDGYAEIDGVPKTQRKIVQDIKCLQKVIENRTVKMHHIKSSNLTFYEFLIKVLQIQNDVVHVDHTFPICGISRPLRVDIVCENGMKWIKAIARNARTIYDAAIGSTNYGVRSVLDQAQDYVEAAERNLCMFKLPKIVFYFSHEIENELIYELNDIGVEVASLTVPLLYETLAPITSTTVLNLDTTTLLAYVSDLCNGGADKEFNEPLLMDQAARERQTPVKLILEKLFENKHIICCRTAYNSFVDILLKLGGTKEKERTKSLLKKIEVMPDIDDIPSELQDLKLTGKINTRSLKIFGFGIKMEAVTVTANTSFVRSAKMQGVTVPVFTHQARALTEMKEKDAPTAETA